MKFNIILQKVAFVKESMHQEPYTIDEIANLLKVNVLSLEQSFL